MTASAPLATSQPVPLAPRSRSIREPASSLTPTAIAETPMIDGHDAHGRARVGERDDAGDDLDHGAQAELQCGPRCGGRRRTRGSAGDGGVAEHGDREQRDHGADGDARPHHERGAERGGEQAADGRVAARDGLGEAEHRGDSFRSVGGTLGRVAADARIIGRIRHDHQSRPASCVRVVRSELPEDLPEVVVDRPRAEEQPRRRRRGWSRPRPPSARSGAPAASGRRACSARAGGPSPRSRAAPRRRAAPTASAPSRAKPSTAARRCVRASTRRRARRSRSPRCSSRRARSNGSSIAACAASARA